MNIIKPILRKVVQPLVVPVTGLPISGEDSEESWSTYWTTHFISALTVVTTSDTAQTVTATIAGGVGPDGVNFEYSTDSGATWSAGITDADGVLSATGLPEGTIIQWRARLYKGTNFGAYTSVVVSATEATAIRHQTGGVNDTVCWIASDDLATITKNGSNVTSRINDKLGSGHDFTAGTCVWSATNGFTFNGSTHFIQTGTFPYAQPEFIYMVARINSVGLHYFLDGYDASHRMVFGLATTISTINNYMYGGSAANTSVVHKAGIWQILRIQFNKTSSYFKQMLLSSAALSVGTQASNGITIGSQNGGAVNFTNGNVLEAIFRKTADDADTEQKIYNYLYGKYYSILTEGITKIVGGIAFTFDDDGHIPSWVTASNRFYPVCGWKATFALNAKDQATAEAEAANVAILQANESKIANHCINGGINGDDYITANGEQAHYDNLIAPCQVLLETYLNTTDKMFLHSYMNGIYPDLATILFNAGFTQIRWADQNQGTPGSETYYDGSSQQIVSNRLVDYLTDIPAIITALEYARDNNVVIVFNDHAINTGNIPIIEKVITYVLENNMTFYTMDELFPSLFE